MKTLSEYSKLLKNKEISLDRCLREASLSRELLLEWMLAMGLLSIARQDAMAKKIRIKFSLLSLCKEVLEDKYQEGLQSIEKNPFFYLILQKRDQARRQMAGGPHDAELKGATDLSCISLIFEIISFTHQSRKNISCVVLNYAKSLFSCQAQLVAYLERKRKILALPYRQRMPIYSTQVDQEAALFGANECTTNAKKLLIKAIDKYADLTEGNAVRLFQDDLEDGLFS